MDSLAVRRREARLSAKHGPRYVTLRMRWDTEKGEFDLRCPQQFVNMDLEIEAQGLARHYFTELPPGAPRRDLALTRGATITGRVLRNGKPAKNITLGAIQADRSFRRRVGAYTTGTGDGGRFVFPNLPGAWVTRARCRMASGDLAGAESDLAACKPILLDHKISPIFAGFHSRAAGWWEVTAESRTRNGDVRDACEAWAEAVKCRRHVASLPQVSGPYTLAALARALRRLGEELEAAGKPEDGQTPMAEALRIWCELGLPEQGLR